MVNMRNMVADPHRWHRAGFQHMVHETFVLAAAPPSIAIVIRQSIFDFVKHQHSIGRMTQQLLGQQKCLKARYTIHGAAICLANGHLVKLRFWPTCLTQQAWQQPCQLRFARAGRTVKQGMETFAHRRIASSQLQCVRQGRQQHIKLGFHVRKIQRTQCRRRGLAHNMADQIIHTLNFAKKHPLGGIAQFQHFCQIRGVFRVGLLHQAATRQRLPFILQPAIRHHHLDIQCAGQKLCGPGMPEISAMRQLQQGFEIILKIHRRQVAQQLHVMLRQAQA